MGLRPAADLVVLRQAAAPRQEKILRIVVATRHADGNAARKSDLKLVELSQKDVPKGVAFKTDDAENRVAKAAVNTNEPFCSPGSARPLRWKASPPPSTAGYRAMSVQITDVSGVAGLIQPGSKVDVIFTRPGSMAEATTSTILQNIKVLSIGRTVQIGATAVDAARHGSRPQPRSLPWCCCPADAQKLELAKNQGKISLSLRHPLDAAQADGTEPITTEVLDPMISARIARARRGRTTNLNRANLEDPNVWQELTGEKKPVDPSEGGRGGSRRKKAEAEALAAEAQGGGGCLPRRQARPGIV